VLPSALSVPAAYGVALPEAEVVKRWAPPSAQFTELLRRRTYIRMKTDWLLNGDLTPLPVKFNYEPVDAILAVARVCPTTKKLALVCTSFASSNLIYEVVLASLEAVRGRPEDAVLSVQEVLLPGAKPVYYEVTELNGEQTGVYLDTAKLVTHVYEVALCPPRRIDIDRRLWESAATRMQNAIDFTSLAVLSKNRLFARILRFIDATPSAAELAVFINRLPAKKERTSLLLKAMFVASRHAVENDRLVLLNNDDLVEAREDKLLAVMKIIKEHADDDVRRLGEALYEENKQGPVMFIAPELGPFSKVGGLSTMVWELAKELVQLGLDIHVVSPYYNVNPKGETGYLARYGVEYKFNVDIYCPDLNPIGVHYGVVDGVKCWFIHNFSFFAAPYQSGSTSFRLKTLVIMARAPLEICCQIGLFPSVIVTNDWMTGLVPAYGRNLFGDAFNQTRFLHIFHNLGVGYAGKLWPNDGNPWAMGDIHQLASEQIIDQFDRSFDPSLAALLATDQWATVSKKYRDELLEGSPYNYFLRRFDQPFAYSNGIRLQERLDALTKLGLDHTEAKRALQQKFFGEVDDSKMVLLFIGRVVEQKGVHLILDDFEELHRKFDGKLQYIVGGQAAPDDRAYGLPQTQKLWDLRHRYPKHFWADPSAFFSDGLLCCQGADLMLVPSLFEPSGIVQQEAFASGCPVLAFKTGGLADTVFEFEVQKGSGNGFVFWAHRHRDYIWAVERAFGVFTNKDQYALLRKNARESVLSTEKVAREWAREFARLFQRFYEPDQPNKEFVLKVPSYAAH
jgi:starch synthase